MGLGTGHRAGWYSPPTSPNSGQPLPRALGPDFDGVVMNVVARLEDPFARIGLTVLRGAGLRVGELLDLELGSVVDYGPAGLGWATRHPSNSPGCAASAAHRWW
ncbi:hypothetical protein KV605_23980 [Rhodococcus opacus]|nr:hypothetical protein [Rhodococcus opacus]MBV6759502.1 hypothetical protein [Rhodococcus opacus]